MLQKKYSKTQGTQEQALVCLVHLDLTLVIVGTSIT